MSSPLMELRGVSRHFAIGGVGSRRTLRAVESVDLSVAPGETLGLIGESGCGKSTLGRVIGQLLPPSKGSLRFEGEDVATLDRKVRRRLRREVQIVFQDPFGSLNPRMTIRDTLAEPLRNFGIARGAEADRRIIAALDMCGMGRGALDRYPRQFSGGQRQRIGIARAIVTNPRLIVADEPVSALDVSIQAQIINLLRQLQAEMKMAMVFIGHDMAVVRHIADRVAVMYLGRIMEIAPASQFYARPLHPYAKVLLSSVPIADPEQERARRPIELSGELPSPMTPPSGCVFHTRCPWAQLPRCSAEVPQLRTLSGGRQVACHYAETLAPVGA